MAKMQIVWPALGMLLILCSTQVLANELHIVYMGNYHDGLRHDVITAAHHDMLTAALGSHDAASQSIVYSYRKSFSGFAANLEPKHVTAISEMDGVLSVFLSGTRQALTTHAWQFLGMEPTIPSQYQTESLWEKTNYGEDVIIGVIDTGFWPESYSYADDGLSEVPSTWNGTCVAGEDFDPKTDCNKKVIGARFYFAGAETILGPLGSGYGAPKSARDTEGHGTHTSSTAAGREVLNANVNGYANGTAKGGAPKAKLAIYKVCWAKGGTATCSDADILAAYDDAVNDGVHILTASLGGNSFLPFHEDATAIGSFHAMAKGILSHQSAGNSGPGASTVVNLAPWALVVGANSLDRDLTALVEIDSVRSSLKFYGQTVGLFNLTTAPLVLGSDISLNNVTAATLCIDGSLDPSKAKGKIVFCLRGENARLDKGVEVFGAGGAGIILGNAAGQGNDLTADPWAGPGLALGETDAATISTLLTNASTSGFNVTATIQPGETRVEVQPAPVMTSFSSAGPNPLHPEILKPDITAPGGNIIAAWTGVGASSKEASKSLFAVESGTSMSCPVVAGVSTLLRALHPTWSPSAIKSAIMTSASVTDNTGNPMMRSDGTVADPFVRGAGMVNPVAAADPGLVYDASVKDYTMFLCTVGYNATQIQIITGQAAVKCNNNGTGTDLNLASLTLYNLEDNPKTVRRVVTNVGGANSVYRLHVENPEGIEVSVWPKELHFKRKNERKVFKVTFKRTSPAKAEYNFGSYTWSDGLHHVRSTVIVGYHPDPL